MFHQIRSWGPTVVLLICLLTASGAASAGEFRLTILHNNDGESQLINAGDGLEDFGGVGATTPDLAFISSPRNVRVDGRLREAIQAEVNGLALRDVRIIVLISHLQSIDNDLELVRESRGVDVVIAGGGQPDAVVPDAGVRNRVVGPVSDALASLASNQVGTSEVVLDGSITAAAYPEGGQGRYEVLWDGRDGFGSFVSSGVYFYRLGRRSCGSSGSRPRRSHQQVEHSLP